MQQFEITLKNDKIKFYKLIALLLILFNLLIFVFLLIADVHFYKAGLALVLSGSYILYLLYVAKKNEVVFFIDRVTFFILAGSWLILQNYLIALAGATLGILYRLSLQKLKFVVNSNFVKKISFPQKTYSWEAIDNVMLRDHILTIDLKNNTLIQLEIESRIDEIQFNEFTQQQLFKNRDLLKNAITD